MQRVASLALLLLGRAALVVHAEFAIPVPPVLHVDPDSPLGKSLIDGAGAQEHVVAPHVVGGQPAGPGQFSYMAMTFTRAGANCSGSILVPGWVISVRA